MIKPNAHGESVHCGVLTRLFMSCATTLVQKNFNEDEFGSKVNSFATLRQQCHFIALGPYGWLLTPSGVTCFGYHMRELYWSVVYKHRTPDGVAELFGSLYISLISRTLGQVIESIGSVFYLLILSSARIQMRTISQRLSTAGSVDQN